MFTKFTTILAGGLAALVAGGALAAAPAYAAGPNGPGRCGGTCQGPAATAMATAPLSDAEKADLAFVREEERLAMDLYGEFFRKYNLSVFGNIAQSEQRHFTAAGNMLTRYGLPDPSADAKLGVYANADLQARYDDWHKRGMESKEAAFQVGIDLEKWDIADLDRMIATSDNADLDRVYGNLKRGSENHLRAFTAAANGQVPGDGTCTGQGMGGQGMGPGQGGKPWRGGR